MSPVVNFGLYSAARAPDLGSRHNEVRQRVPRRSRLFVSVASPTQRRVQVRVLDCGTREAAGRGDGRSGTIYPSPGEHGCCWSFD